MEPFVYKDPIKVLVTGANGKIAYTLLPHLLSGSAFGNDQPIILHLLVTERSLDRTDGLVMEIQDSVFPLLHDLVVTTELDSAFKDVDVAILMASAPRNKAVRRTDLLFPNARIAQTHGQALNKYAKRSVKTERLDHFEMLVLVVTNPCNTMAYVCRSEAPSLTDSNFTCLTQLDHNRTVYQVASHLGVDKKAVKNVAILGNHSQKVVVDLSCSSVNKPSENFVLNMSSEEELDIQEAVRRRGGHIIGKRLETSNISVTAAIIGHLDAWWNGTKGQWVSMGVASDGSYGVPEGLFCSFPVTVSSDKRLTIVPNILLAEVSKEYLQESVIELQEEKKCAESALASLLRNSHDQDISRL